MRILGILLILFGFVLCLTLIGAGLGIIMIILGLILVALGGRRHVIVHNIVQVSNTTNAAGPDASESRRWKTLDSGARATRIEPPTRTVSRIQSVDMDLDYDDEPLFTDLKNEISMAAKQALARLKASGLDLRVRPDGVLLMRGGNVVATLSSNDAIISYAEEYGLGA